MKNRPVLEILETDEPAWTRWPGRWGDTLPRTAVESNSPTGPGAKKQWTQPDKMLDNPPGRPAAARAPQAPEVRALRTGGRLRIEYDVTEARAAAAHARRDGELRGRAQRAAADAQHPRCTRAATARSRPTIVLDPLKRYDVHTSTIAGDPPVPSETTRNDIAPFGAEPPRPSLPQRALAGVSRAFAVIRGDRF